MTPARPAFLIGAGVGFAGGLVVLIGPPIGAAILALAAIARPRPATAAGVLVGASIGMAMLLLVASSGCTRATGCTAPDLTGWIIAIAVCLGVGLLLAGMVARRSTT